jgi:electron transfer flavoprotein alpha subunit
MDGAAVDVGLELLNSGRRVAAILGVGLAAVVFGQDAQRAVSAAAAYGADRIVWAQDEALLEYNPETYAAAMRCLVEKYRPGALLLGATSNGRDFAPRLACLLRTGLTADCTALEADAETGNIQWVRPAFSGSLLAVVECPAARPQMGTVRPGVFQKPAFYPRRQAEVLPEHIPGLPRPGARLARRLSLTQGGEVPLEEAQIIVAGGRGVGKAAHFSLLWELAEVLGASVAASRAAVDAGWLPCAHQVGQTGKTVRPKVYIACGISGAAQHLAGISGAQTLVAINGDPQAPIFGAADIGVVGDLREILPALTREIRRIKSGG